jgi:hypothetical protein
MQQGLKRYPAFLGFDVFAGVAGRQGSHCRNQQNTKTRVDLTSPRLCQVKDKAESPNCCQYIFYILLCSQINLTEMDRGTIEHARQT